MFYLLDFVKQKHKKKSYAASLGGMNFTEKEIEILVKEVSTFSNVLVREKSGQKFLQQQGIKSEMVLDPTFLLDKQRWSEFSRNTQKRNVKKYVLVYHYYKSKEICSRALNMQKNMIWKLY